VRLSKTCQRLLFVIAFETFWDRSKYCDSDAGRQEPCHDCSDTGRMVGVSAVYERL
jgi:hypothetical protein